MISKVVIFFNANIFLPNFVWKFKQFFFKEFTLVGPCLSHEIQSKTDFSSEPTPFKCTRFFLTGAIDMLLSRLTPLPSLVGSTEPFTHRGAKVGSLKVKNHVSSCVGQQSNALP